MFFFIVNFAPIEFNIHGLHIISLFILCQRHKGQFHGSQKASKVLAFYGLKAPPYKLVGESFFLFIFFVNKFPTNNKIWIDPHKLITAFVIFLTEILFYY